MKTIDKFREAIVNIVRKDTPVGAARSMALSLLASGKITQEEASTLLGGLETVNMTFSIDNSVEISGTHWGDIATGGAVIEEGYFARQRDIKIK